MKTRRQMVGRWGEEAAAKHLTGHGLNIIERNVRTPYGELDLIALDVDELVFIEVKTRTSLTFGMPEDAVNHAKRLHLMQAAEAYLQDHPDKLSGGWRIDVVAIVAKSVNEFEVEWFKNAVA